MSDTATDQAPDDAYEPARELIAERKIDLLTCDVFDTLVWRPVALPRDLFVELGRRLTSAGLLPPHVQAVDFAGGRHRAEYAARLANRRQQGSLECNLDDIWAQMPASWLADDDPRRQRYIQAELELEGEQLRTHPHACELLRLAHTAGIATALVSDTYFTSTQLRRLLESAGVPLDAVDRIDVSCEAKLPKYEGLLKQVIEDCSVIPSRVLHLGDNPIADIAAATDVGARAQLADVADRWSPAVLDSIERYSSQSGDDMGVTALTRSTLLSAGESGQRADYQFGATVGGPVLHGFARWVSASAERFGVDTIHCLLREGGVIADLVDTVRPDGPSTRTVHASRWVNMRAAVISGTPEELFRALARKAKMQPSHVTAAFGVDQRLVAQVIGASPIDDAQRVEAIHQIAEHDELRGQIVEASAEMRTRLLRYLDTVLDPTNGRLVLCDIGWGGTIQEGLRDILVHEGRIADPNNVIGLYLMLSQAGLERRYSGQRLYSYLPARSSVDPQLTVIARNPEILEQLCTPDQGTLLDIADDGSPVCAEHDPTMTPSRLIAQKAVFDAVRSLSAFEPRNETDQPRDPWLDMNLRSALLEGLATSLQAPSPELARSLSGWLHDDLGGDAVVPLAAPDDLEFLSFVNAAEISEIDMRDVFWLPGAAATNNPMLAEQLAAVERGADAERLSPPSPAGQVSVAIFEPGNDEAVALSRPLLRTGAHGWSYVRLAVSVDSVRAVRIDFGDVDHLVELDHLHIAFNGKAAAGETTWRIDRVDDPRVNWNDGRVVSPSRAAVEGGGFLLANVAGTPLESSTHVNVQCAFRVSPLNAQDAAILLRGTALDSARTQAQRAVSAARARVQRGL